MAPQSEMRVRLPSGFPRGNPRFPPALPARPLRKALQRIQQLIPLYVAGFPYPPPQHAQICAAFRRIRGARKKSETDEIYIIIVVPLDI